MRKDRYRARANSTATNDHTILSQCQPCKHTTPSPPLFPTIQTPPPPRTPQPPRPSLNGPRAQLTTPPLPAPHSSTRRLSRPLRPSPASATAAADAPTADATAERVTNASVIRVPPDTAGYLYRVSWEEVEALSADTAGGWVGRGESG